MSGFARAANATQIAGTPVSAVSPTNGQALVFNSATGLYVPTTVPQLKATTGAAGYTLVNGTGNILTITTPNDGNLHAVYIAAVLVISATETGGTIQVNWTTGGSANSVAIFNGGLGGPGIALPAFTAVTVDPNQGLIVRQQTALTGGGAKLFCTLHGD